MEYTFNELSLSALDPINEDELFEFAAICVALFSKGFKVMKIVDRNDFMSHPINSKKSVGEWIKTFKGEAKENLLVQKFRSIIAASSKVVDIETNNLIDACPLIYVDVNGVQLAPKGLKIACILKTFSVSFSKFLIWRSHFVKALWIEEIDSSDLIEQNVDIRHIGTDPHIRYHEEWFNLQIRCSKSFLKWNPSKEYFPNLDYSNELVKDSDWEDYWAQYRNASTEQRRSIILNYGIKVAERNNYQYDNKISALNTSKNKKRKIFHAGSGRDRIYLSIDLETGGFEVCDYSGSHLGEYFYDGKKTKNASSDHNIIVS